MPLPHVGDPQSSSFDGSQPGPQHMSPSVQVSTAISTHSEVHMVGSPLRVAGEQASVEVHVSTVGQLSGGSQVSPGSTTPLPHCGRQSLSVVSEPSSGQQPSSSLTSVMTSSVHSVWQSLPVNRWEVHPCAAGHSVGQAPSSPSGIPVSQVSSPAIWPSPQDAGQPGAPSFSGSQQSRRTGVSVAGPGLIWWAAKPAPKLMASQSLSGSTLPSDSTSSPCVVKVWIRSESDPSTPSGQTPSSCHAANMSSPRTRPPSSPCASDQVPSRCSCSLPVNTAPSTRTDQPRRGALSLFRFRRNSSLSATR